MKYYIYNSEYYIASTSLGMSTQKLCSMGCTSRKVCMELQPAAQHRGKQRSFTKGVCEPMWVVSNAVSVAVPLSPWYTLPFIWDQCKLKCWHQVAGGHGAKPSTGAPRFSCFPLMVHWTLPLPPWWVQGLVQPKPELAWHHPCIVFPRWSHMLHNTCVVFRHTIKEPTVMEKARLPSHETHTEPSVSTRAGCWKLVLLPFFKHSVSLECSWTPQGSPPPTFLQFIWF